MTEMQFWRPKTEVQCWHVTRRQQPWAPFPGVLPARPHGHLPGAIHRQGTQGVQCSHPQHLILTSQQSLQPFLQLNNAVDAWVHPQDIWETSCANLSVQKLIKVSGVIRLNVSTRRSSPGKLLRCQTTGLHFSGTCPQGLLLRRFSSAMKAKASLLGMHVSNLDPSVCSRCWLLVRGSMSESAAGTAAQAAEGIPIVEHACTLPRVFSNSPI